MSQADVSVDNINKSSEMVENALNTFDSIFENIDSVNTLVGQMIEKVERVDEVASNVAAISEEQAVEACKEAGIDLSAVPVLGVDATAEGCAAIEAGEMAFTVYQSGTGQGGGSN